MRINKQAKEKGSPLIEQSFIHSVNTHHRNSHIMDRTNALVHFGTGMRSTPRSTRYFPSLHHFTLVGTTFIEITVHPLTAFCAKLFEGQKLLFVDVAVVAAVLVIAPSSLSPLLKTDD